MRVLVVDHDPAYADVTAYTLRNGGFEVSAARDGSGALERLQVENFDLVLLDLDIPGVDGWTLLKRIRAEREFTAIIVLSVQRTETDMIKALEAGADDYLVKPFSPANLLARVRAIWRRTGNAPTDSVLTYGDLSFDLARRIVRRSSETNGVQLTPLEYRLLKTLIVNGGQVLPNETLIGSVWGVDGGDRVMLKQLVHRLRQKIEPVPARPIYIETIPGVGYALNAKR